MAECHMGNIYRYLCIIEISSEISGKKKHMSFLVACGCHLPRVGGKGCGSWMQQKSLLHSCRFMFGLQKYDLSNGLENCMFLFMFETTSRTSKKC